MSCGFWPLVHSWEYPWSSQSFPSERTAGVSSRSFTVTNKSNSLTYTVASSFVCTSPLAVTTVVGLSETLTVSNSTELKSFLLTMCILAPESTTNSLSSGFIVDAAGKIHSSAGEKNVVFVLFFELVNMFGQSPRVSAGASLLSFSLLLRSVLKFYSAGTALMRKFDLYFIQRWTLAFSDVCLTQRSSCESYSSNLVPKLLGPSEKSLQILAAQRPSSDTQPNCRTLFHIATALWSSSFFRLFARLTFNLPFGKRAHIAEFTSLLWLFKLTFGRMPIVTK